MASSHYGVITARITDQSREKNPDLARVTRSASNRLMKHAQAKVKPGPSCKVSVHLNTMTRELD